VPDDSSVELLELKGGKQNMHKEFIEMCNTEIAVTILGQNLTTEVKGGSFASSKTHKEVLESITTSDVELIEESLNNLVKTICEVNSKPLPPKLVLYPSKDIDLELANRDKTLTEQGVKFTKAYYMREYGFKEEDIEVGESEESRQGRSFSEGNSTLGFAQGGRRQYMDKTK